jgi:hypothetical protein
LRLQSCLPVAVPTRPALGLVWGGRGPLSGLLYVSDYKKGPQLQGCACRCHHGERAGQKPSQSSAPQACKCLMRAPRSRTSWEGSSKQGPSNVIAVALFYSRTHKGRPSDGRYQALGIAWDSRSNDQGGQRTLTRAVTRLGKRMKGLVLIGRASLRRFPWLGSSPSRLDLRRRP